MWLNHMLRRVIFLANESAMSLLWMDELLSMNCGRQKNVFSTKATEEYRQYIRFH